jgi:hypothetical protein
MHRILDRLRPLVEQIIAHEIVGPESSKIRHSVEQSISQVENHLVALGFPPSADNDAEI